MRGHGVSGGEPCMRALCYAVWWCAMCTAQVGVRLVWVPPAPFQAAALVL